MHYPTDRIIHTRCFVTPVVEHWLEQDLAQWVHHEGSIRWLIAPWAIALTTEIGKFLTSDVSVGIWNIRNWITKLINSNLWTPAMCTALVQLVSNCITNVSSLWPLLYVEDAISELKCIVLLFSHLLVKNYK